MSPYYRLLFILCYLSILIATITAITYFKRLNNAFRIIALLLLLTSVSELVCFIVVLYENYGLRYTIYHFYGIVQAFLISSYFIYAIKPVYHRKLMVAAGIFWIAVGGINICFFQPLQALNTNMLMVESFVFITISLYFIYITLKRDAVQHIFRYPYFWMAVIWLVTWSTSISFWAFVKIIYRGQGEFIKIAITVQSIIEILSYLSIAATIYLFNKQMLHNEKR
jgi:hypothetical protein